MPTNTIEKVIKSIVHERPGLQSLWTNAPILDYLHPAVTWKQQTSFPYADTLSAILISHIERLYGTDAAEGVTKQLQNSWVIETGAHLHIPRRYNKVAPTQEAQINPLLFQGQMLWGYANHLLGNKFSISLNSGRVPLDNTNSGAYLDLPALKSPLTLASKRKHPDSPQSLIPARTKEEIKEKMDLLDMYKKQKLIPENQYKLGQQVLKNFFEVQTSFSDQVSTSHALLLNTLLPLKQITLDSEAIAKEFIIKLLKDSTSLTHTLFANPDRRRLFLKELGNIQTGWTEKSSPFYQVHRSGEGFRLVQYDGELDPDTIVKGLEKNTLWPTGVMKFFVYTVEAGILSIGGWTQAGYCTEIKTQSEKLLRELGYDARADALQHMPTQIVTVGPCWGIDTTNGKTKLLDPITAILDPASFDLSIIARMSGKETFILGAPTLYEFLFRQPSSVGYAELAQSRFNLE